MIEKLTAEHEKLANEIREEYIKFALSGATDIDISVATEAINYFYSKINKKNPEIYIADSPYAGINYANKFLSTKIYTTDNFGLSFDSGWVAFYDFFTRINTLNDEKFNVIVKFLKAGVWDTILFENLAILIRRPIKINKDANDRLHCENGPAVLFKDDFKIYAWHGTRVSEKLIEHPEQITKKEITDEKNSEVSRATAEKLGWTRYLEIVDAVLVHKWEQVIPQKTKRYLKHIDNECPFNNSSMNLLMDSCKDAGHFREAQEVIPMQILHYELFDFKKRFELTPRLLKMESPELLDGTKPFYIEPVDPKLNTCEAARKWQFKKPDGTWPTVEECNENPEMVFDFEA